MQVFYSALEPWKMEQMMRSTPFTSTKHRRSSTVPLLNEATLDHVGGVQVRPEIRLPQQAAMPRGASADKSAIGWLLPRGVRINQSVRPNVAHLRHSSV